MLRTGLLTVMLALGFSSAAMAGERNDVPSCYKHAKIEAPANLVSRDLTVIVDQTVEFDRNLVQSTYDKVTAFVKPGDRIRIVRMSAYGQDSYLDVLWNGVLEPDLTKDARYSAGKRYLAKFDKCKREQSGFVKKKVGAQLKDVFFNRPEKLPNTELMGSLGVISRDLIKPSLSAEKHVLIASDMVENSAMVTFYRGNLKNLNVGKVLGQAEESGFIGDFDNSKVYVIGAGFVPKGKQASYTDQRSMNNMREFWSRYFEESKAKLVAFGQPNLLRNIGE